MTEYMDPEEGVAEGSFWRIQDHKDDVVIIMPTIEHVISTEQSEKTPVTDGIGAVWNAETQQFSAVGSVRVFQEVLRRKLSPVMARNAVLVARIVRPGRAYDFQAVDADTRKAVIDCWENTEPEESKESNEVNDPF